MSTLASLAEIVGSGSGTRALDVAVVVAVVVAFVVDVVVVAAVGSMTPTRVASFSCDCRRRLLLIDSTTLDAATKRSLRLASAATRDGDVVSVRLRDNDGGG